MEEQQQPPERNSDSLLEQIRDHLAELAQSSRKPTLRQRIVRLRSLVTLALVATLCIIRFPTSDAYRAALEAEDGATVSLKRLKMPESITLHGEQLPIDPNRWEIPQLGGTTVTLPILKVELVRGGLAYFDPTLVATRIDQRVVARLTGKHLHIQGPTTIRIEPEPTGLGTTEMRIAKRIIETHGLLVGEQIVRLSDFVDYNTGVGRITIAAFPPPGLPRLFENVSALFGLASSR